jgi:hypothetical protein
LNQIQEFFEFHVNDKEEGCNYIENENKVNPVPRHLIAQERLFDRQDGHKHKGKSGVKPCDHFEVNIENDKEPRMVKVDKSTPIEERKEIVKLLKEYRNVLAFTYDKLNVYREDVIQYVIPLKEDTKPFRQKLRQINPKLSPLVLLTAYSARSQLMCHEDASLDANLMKTVLVLLGHLMPQHKNFVNEISAPLRGLIM